MIHIYTGNGPGKTTAALGLALRSLGWGRKVTLVQFLKMRPSGELRSLVRFEDCRICRFGKEDFLLGRSPDAGDRREAEAGIEEAEKILREGSADLLILDEINVALDLRLLPPERVIRLISNCPPETELVLTGRNCPEAILGLGDYVSEITSLRHPFDRAAPAREGVEY